MQFVPIKACKCTLGNTYRQVDLRFRERIERALIGARTTAGVKFINCIALEISSRNFLLLD